MSLAIEEIKTKKGLRPFIKFPFKLYKGSPYYVPPLIPFELSTLLWNKNPAFDHCEARYWVVKRAGEIVGRVAAIKHNQEFEEKKLIRFGWIDFIDDLAVSGALLEQVMQWAEELGGVAIHGPLGFTDLDFEGTLESGFEELTTQGTIYNYPYYADHFRQYDFEVATKWVELRWKIPNEVPKRTTRTANLVRSRFNFQVKEFKKAKEILKYANGVFEVLNESFTHLYGYYPLSQRQIDYFVDQYFGMARREYVIIVTDENDEVIGFSVGFPSLSKAFQKAKGSLFPFGFIHLLRAIRSNKHLDLFLVGVKPEYQRHGVIALIFEAFSTRIIEKGVKKVSTGPMLEENSAVLGSWSDFPKDLSHQDIKRTCFIKHL